MPANLKVIASRISNMRSMLSYSPIDVELATGISQARLKDIESESSTPSGDEILILATLYNCDFRTLLDERRPPPDEKTGILFRRYNDSFTSADRRSVQEFIYLCQIESSIENLLGQTKIDFQFSPSGTFYKSHGQLGAQALRVKLGYRENEAPRDIYKDFRNVGIHVFRRRLENNEISGLYVKDSVAGHCILINYNEDIYRQRFSAAHEAAHSIFDSEDDVMVTYHKQNAKYSTNDLKEIRANSFSSQYLMPIEMLRTLSKLDSTSAVKWAQEFRVSTAALAKALKDAQLISDKTAVEIRNIRVPSVEKIDPEAPENLSLLQRERRLKLMERGLSDHYVHICFEAHYKELISTGRLIEALQIDRSELAEVGLLYGRTIKHGL